MKNIKTIATIIVICSLSLIEIHAGTLDQVQSKGALNCIVNTGNVGFAAPDENGRWQGFEIDLCRAVAAAVLGDAEKVKFIPATSKTRFTLLNSGEGDILFRTATQTMSRDADLKLTFLPVNYYDGQGFLIAKNVGIHSPLELDGASVCIRTGTTTELNLADFFRTNNMSYEPVAFETVEESITAYSSGRCDVYTTDVSGLAAARTTLENPSAHIILPQIISKEPLAGAVRQGDEQWADIGRWVVNALINAEELGITQANVKALAKTAGNNPSINRMLGSESDMGAMIGLDKAWAVRAISAVGNYGEMFERHLGGETAIGLKRGLNALWRDGGILYAAPIR